MPSFLGLFRFFYVPIGMKGVIKALSFPCNWFWMTSDISSAFIHIQLACSPSLTLTTHIRTQTHVVKSINTAAMHDCQSTRKTCLCQHSATTWVRAHACCMLYVTHMLFCLKNRNFMLICICTHCYRMGCHYCHCELMFLQSITFLYKIPLM